MTPKKEKFPNQIYVYWDGESSAQYMIATPATNDELHGLEHGKTVAVYKRVDVLKVSKTVGLVKP